MSAPMLTPDPTAVAGPAPGAVPTAPAVPAAVPPPAPPVAGMPQMPGMPPAAVGPAGPHFDPTGTVPVAGSPADPLHPAQQAARAAAAAAPAVAPVTAEDAAQRRYTADQGVADIDQKLADNAAESAKADDTKQAKEAELQKAQAAETAAEQARQQAGLTKAQAERDQLRQNVADFKFHNFWDTRSTGQKILAGIGIILGSASYSKEHVNEAAKTIDNAVASEWEQQKAELQRRTDQAASSGANERELRLQYDYESGQLKLRQEQQLHALANQLDALSARSKNQAGVLMAQKVAAEARALAEQHGQQGVKEIAEAHTQSLKDAEIQAQTGLANAKAGKAKRAGAGGGVSGDAYAAFLDAAGKLKPGDPISNDVGRLAARAGIKVKDIPGQVKQIRESGAASQIEANKAAGVKAGQTPGELPKDTVYLDKQPIGLAPSGRGGAAAIGQQLLKYRNSIKSLEELRDYVKDNATARIPALTGGRYDRAVLAVAATTQAPGTDRTTQHEADTLKSLHILSPDAIQRSIDHLKSLETDFKGLLRPLPGAAGAGGFKNAPPGAPAGAITGTLNGKRGYVLNGQFTAF